jgi:uncharacterized membrane protein HdeD (DUF308 family)
MITDEMKSVYNRSKWALVVRGLLGIALGIFIIARPLESVAAFALVIAIWALGDGIVSIVHAVELRAVAPHWWVLLLTGSVSTLFGIAALYYYPGLSLTFVVLWTALWLLTAGVLAVYVAIQERKANLSWGWTMVFGLVASVGGILAVMYPGITLAGLISLIAAFGIVSGVALLIGAGKMQSFERDVNRAVRNPVRT